MTSLSRPRFMTMDFSRDSLHTWTLSCTTIVVGQERSSNVQTSESRKEHIRALDRYSQRLRVQVCYFLLISTGSILPFLPPPYLLHRTVVFPNGKEKRRDNHFLSSVNCAEDRTTLRTGSKSDPTTIDKERQSEFQVCNWRQSDSEYWNRFHRPHYFSSHLLPKPSPYL